jgi:outer membrane biosynthesis protein TonB
VFFSARVDFRKWAGYALAFSLSAAPMSVLAQSVGAQSSDMTGAAQRGDHNRDSPIPALADIPVIQMKSLARRPSLVPVFKALASSNISEAHAELLVEYNMQGDITDVRFLKSAGNGSVNKAILEWAKRVKLIPGEAGRGRLPFDMEVR